MKILLSNQSVQEVLYAPLDGQSELDWQLLRGIWSELRTADDEPRLELPTDFDWEKLATRYRGSINRQMLSDPELRPVIQALAAISTAETTERTAAAVTRLAGPTRSFNLPATRAL
jgi:hypothetical protein